MIHRVNGYFEENIGNKYLSIDDTNSEILKKYNQLFDGIKYHINKIDEGECVYDKDYMKIKFSSDDDIPLDKILYFHTITVIIRCVFEKNGIYYSQVYLDECLYQV